MPTGSRPSSRNGGGAFCLFIFFPLDVRPYRVFYLFALLGFGGNRIRYSRVCVLLLDRRRVYANGGSGMSSGMDDSTVAVYSSSGYGDDEPDDVDGGGVVPAAASCCRCGRSSDPARDVGGARSAAAAFSIARRAGAGCSVAGRVAGSVAGTEAGSMAGRVAGSVAGAVDDDDGGSRSLRPPGACCCGTTTSCNHPRSRFRYDVRAANMTSAWPHGRAARASPADR